MSVCTNRCTIALGRRLKQDSFSLRPLDRRRYISAYGYTQAKSLVYTKHGEPKDELEVHSHSLSPPHSQLVTLRTLAAPLNPADINQIQGTYPALPPFTNELGTAAPAAIPGNEGVFEVLSCGGGVREVSKGDWVIARNTGLGTWRTHLQVPAEKVVRIERSGLQPVHAATVGVNPVTAWRMLTDFAPLDGAQGHWMVQNGANSGVGRAAIQLCRLWGIRNIAVVRDRPGAEGEKLRAELHSLGATHVVTEEQALAKGFGEQVKEWTNGGREPVRLALNCVGGKPGVALAKVLAPAGVHVTYGAMSRQPLALPAGLLIFKNLNFTGFWVSKWSEQHPEEKIQTVTAILDLIRDGKFHDSPMVEIPWNWETPKHELVDAVQGTLDGYRKGKSVFRFGDT